MGRLEAVAYGEACGECVIVAEFRGDTGAERGVGIADDRVADAKADIIGVLAVFRADREAREAIGGPEIGGDAASRFFKSCLLYTSPSPRDA